ncbi:MAG TPA: glycosyltransferase family 4 protein, partial [Candidatus Polarisedimenticolaceae bacterium]|nr:glycosyltransferase family 4 protein [Candidatus Polarisedimenticolaceae bacterium]
MSRKAAGYLFALPWELGHVGGVNTVVASLMERCRREGSYTPLLMINLWSYRRLQVRRDRGVPVARVRLRNPITRPGGLRSAVAYVLTFPFTALQLAIFLRRQRVRVVNPHYPGLWALHFVLLRALGLYRGRVVLSFHGVDLEQLAGARGLERALRNLLLRRADAIVACSRYMARRIEEVAPECASKVSVVRNGVDVEALQRSARSRQLLPQELRGRRYVLSIGTYEPKKGQDVLIRAFARVAAQYPDLLLVIAGRSGPSAPLLTRLRVQYGLEQRVRLLEDVPWHRIGAVIGEAVLFVLPSRQEPFGIAALEAGALAKAVIASNVGGIPEFIENGKNGLLVGVGDEEALAQRMRALLDAPEDCERIGQRLFADVNRAFSWEVVWRAYLAISRGQAPRPGISVEPARGLVG